MFCIQGKYKVGLFKYIPAFMIFHQKYLAVCAVGRKEMRQFRRDINAHLKAEHMGMLKRHTYIDHGIEDCGQRYAHLSKTRLLADNRQNTAVDYDQIIQTVFQPREETENGEFIVSIPGKIKIQFPEGEILFIHGYDTADETGQTLINCLSKQLGSRLSIRR